MPKGSKSQRACVRKLESGRNTLSRVTYSEQACNARARNEDAASVTLTWNSSKLIIPERATNRKRTKPLAKDVVKKMLSKTAVKKMLSKNVVKKCCQKNAVKK